MSYYGKAAANPEFLESWQTQLDAIRDIFRWFCSRHLGPSEQCFATTLTSTLM
eukprot:m.61715 g.61715  ORF g.61715 m.61715 type:complete len:53 (+) comp9575_c0_seq1:190-348(+)